MARTLTATTLRRRLAMTTALGLSLGVFVTPAAAQVTPAGTVVPNLPGQGISAEPGAAQPTIGGTSVPGMNVGDPVTNTTNITLNAKGTLINWLDLNVITNATRVDTLNFANGTGNTTVAVLNRVITPAPGNTTTLSGTINAPGVEVWISNPNGMVFGAGGNFNGAALVATTLNVSNTAANNFLANTSMALTAPNTASAGITGAIQKIATNGGSLVLLAPVINLTAGNFDASGTGTPGNVAFVTASEVTITTPSSPFGIVIGKGVTVDNDGIVALGGTVTGNNVYAVVSAQNARNALLNISAAVTSASVTNGVVVLGGSNNETAIGDISFGATPADHNGTATVTVGGAITSAGNYTAIGNLLTLGTAATTVVQTAANNVVARADGGTLTGVGALSLRANTDGTAGEGMTLTGSTGINFDATSSLISGLASAPASNIDFNTGAQTDPFTLGAVTAGTLSQGGVGAGTLSRAGAITVGDLTLRAANTIATTNAASKLTVGAVTAGAGLITLQTTDADIEVKGAISNLATTTGGVTVNAQGATNLVSLQGSTLEGTLSATAGSGGITFTTLAGGGGKSLSASGPIGGATAAIEGGTAGISTTGAGAAGAITLASLGGTTPLSIVGLNTAGAVTIGATGSTATNLQVTGTLTVGNAIAPSSFTVNGASNVKTINLANVAGTVEFTGAVTGDSVAPSTFTVNASGVTTLRGPVTNYSSFNSSGAGAVQFNGGTLTTTGNQTFTGELRLGAAKTTLTGSDANFNGGIQGNGNDLSLNFTGDQTLNSSQVVGVKNLITDDGVVASGRTIFTDAGATVAVSTTGLQQYNDAVVLNKDASFTSTGTGAAGAISFNGTVNSAAGVNRSLTVTAPGGATFGGVVGAIDALSSVDTSASASTAINANVTTTGAQTYSAATIGGAAGVTVASTGAGAITFNGTVSGTRGLTVNTGGVTEFKGAVGTLPSLTTDAGGGTKLSTGSVTTTGAQVYGDQLTLTQATTLTGTFATFTAVTGGVVGAGNNLTLNMSGDQHLGSNVTGVAALDTDSVTVAGTTTFDSGFTTTGAQTYRDPAIVGGAAVTLNATGNLIRFGSTVVGAADNAQGLKIDSNAEFDGDVGGPATGTLTRLATLEVTGTTLTGGTGTRTIRTGGNQIYTGLLTLGTNTVLVGAGATFTGGVDGVAGQNRDLTLTFTGNSVLASNLNNLGSLTVNGTGETTISSNVTTVNNQTYLTPGAALKLGADATLTSTNNGTIQIGTLTGNNFRLTVNTGGDTRFANGVTGIRSITTNAGGRTLLNGTLEVSEFQTFNDNVVLESTTTVRSTGAGNLRFGGTVTGPFALTVATNNPGVIQFVGAVGSASGSTNSSRTTLAGSPASLTTTNVGAGLAGQTEVYGGLIATTGAQNFAGNVKLFANTDFVGSSGNFAGGVNANGFSVGYNYASTLSDNGLCALAANCNFFAPVFIDSDESATGTINYNGTVIVRKASAVLTAGGGVRFGSTVEGNTDGGQALTVTATGTTTFNNTVGATNRLSQLTVNGTGPIALNGSLIRTTGNQNYRGAVTLGNNVQVQTNDGSTVTFQSTVDSDSAATPRRLLVQTGTGTPASGTVNFQGKLGGTRALDGLGIRTGSVTSVAGNNVTELAAVVNGAFSFDNEGSLLIGNVATLAGITAAGQVTITQGVVSQAGTLTLADPITGVGVDLTGKGITQFTNGTINAGTGAIRLDGNDGAITLNGALTTTNATATAVRILDATNVQLANITTGAGGTVTLGTAGADTLSGAVTQLAGSVITAGTLVSDTGSAVLNNANLVGTLGANTAANGFRFLSAIGAPATALTVNGPINAGTGPLALRTTTAGVGIVLAGNLIATTAGTTTTLGSAGIINQTGGTVAADLLTTSSVGNTTLNQAGNAINKLGAITTTSGGNFALTDASALTTTVNVLQANIAGTLTIRAASIDYTGRELSATGDVTLLANGAGATDVVGGTSRSGGALTITANRLASLGTGAAGSIGMGAGTVFLGSGDATGLGTLSAGAGGVTIGTYLRAGSGATAVSAGGPAVVNEIKSTNGQVKVSGTTATITTATATNGDLDLRSTNGALQLTTGTAATSAFLSATGALVGGVDTGTLTSGNLTITGATGPTTLTSTGAMSAGNVSSGGTINLSTTNKGDLKFGALTGNGAKNVTSVNGIAGPGAGGTGASIDGTGAVKLVAGTTATDTIQVGAIGATNAVASLTVNGGQQVTLGAIGVTSQVTGATRIGQAGDGALTNALTLRGTLTSGSVLSTTAGQTQVETVTVNAPGAMTFTTTGAGGDFLFTTLNGTGAKTVSAFGNITGNPAGNSISSGGAVTLTGTQNASTATVQQIGVPGTGVASLVIDTGGQVTLGIANSSIINVRAVNDINVRSRLASVFLDGSMRAGGNIILVGGTSVEVDDVRAGLTNPLGNLDVNAGTFVDAGLLYAPNNVTVTAGTSLTAVDIEGGNVRLRAGTASPIRVDQIGVDAVTGPVASLTINGGSTVTLGGLTPTTATNVRVTGPTRIGQIADGPLTGALTINGNFQSTGGSFTSTTTNGTTIGAINGTGATAITAGTASPITIAGGIGATNAVGTVTINGGSVVTIGGATTPTAINATGAVTVGNVTATGSLLVTGTIVAPSVTTTTTGLTDLDDVTSDGAILLTTTGTGDVTFGTLQGATTGAGAKTIQSGGGIAGTSILGTGAVSLTAATTKDVSITGVIGTTAARAASLTINGGAQVTLGTGTGGTTVATSGAVQIGQTTAVGALTVNGAIDAGTSVAATGAGLIDVDAVKAGTAIALTSTGNSISFDTLTSAGTAATGTVLTSATAGGVNGNAIDTAGTVRVIASATSPVAIGTIGATTAPAALTMSGGSSVTLGSASVAGNIRIGQAADGALTGALTVNGPLTTTNNGSITTTTTGATKFVGTVTSPGALSVTTTSASMGDVTFAALAGNGSKAIRSAASIKGTSIDGTGAVLLAAGTAGTIAVDTIGTTTAPTATSPAAALTINGGTSVTLGATGATGTTVNIAGDVRIGQAADGAATGTLTVNGALVDTGTLTTTTTGASTFGDVTSTGNLSVTTGTGNATFRDVSGAGTKTVVSGAGISARDIRGAGAVALTAGPATTAANTLTVRSIGATGAPVAALTVNGGSVATFGTVGSTDANLVVNGATSIGQTAATGALLVNGKTSTGSLTSTTTGDTTFTDAVTGTGAVSVTATGGNLAYTSVNGGSIALTAGGTVTGGVLTSGAAVSVTAGGAATITGGTSGGTGDFAVTAGAGAGGVGVATVSGAVAAGGAYRVKGSAVSLGTGTTSQTANGLVDITSTAGGITASNGLTLQSNADGAGGGSDYLVLDATGGPISFGNATLLGGTAAQRSDIGVAARTAGQPITLGVVNGRSLSGVNAARTSFGTLTNAGDITATGAVTVQQSLALTSTGGAISLQTVDVTGAGQGITLTTAAPSGGAIGAVRLTAPGAVAIDARGAASVTNSLNGGSGNVKGATVDLATVNVGGGALTVTSTAGLLRVNTVTSGVTTLDATGNLEVTNSLTTTGLTTIKSTGNSAIRQVRVTGAALDVNATGSVAGVGTGRADLGTTGAGNNLTVKAGTSALLGPIAAGGNASLTAGTTLDVTTTTAGGSIAMTGAAITSGQANAGTTLALTSTGNLTITGSNTATGNVTFDAGGTAAISQVVTATTGTTISIKATDAAITGTQRAGTVVFTNRVPANTMKLGNGTSTGAGFALSADEVNFVDAGQLTFDAATGNIEFGTLPFNALAGKTRVDVLTTGRIDVSGTVSGGGAGRTFRFGGSSTATDKASILSVVAAVNTGSIPPAASDTGGRLIFDTADLDLRAAKIGVGQVGFLDAIGISAGKTPQSAQTIASDFVGNPNSSLYNATYAGSVYTGALVLVSARSLTVRYTDYALFQNTGTPGNNAGVVLASSASPANPALTLQGGNSAGPNAFAIFGTINGIGGTATAVAGSTVISVNGAQLGNTRVNGCLAGSGAGCLSSVVSQPLLNIFDSSRLAVFTAGSDLALPFDPVVGTNNEALFSGFGLIDAPITDTECTPDTTNPACGQNKEQGK